MKILAKEHGLAVLAQASPGVWELAGSASTGYWSRVPGSTSAFVSSNYFDLAGMSMEDKTLFFEAAGVQSPLAPAIATPTAGDQLIIADLMSSSPLTDLEALNVLIFGNFPPAPISFQETIYGRIEQHVVDVDTLAWGSLKLLNSQQIGSMMPTASDRVYSYRVVLCSGVSVNAVNVTVAAARHILQANAKAEPDHEYMMRLLRSYQLQQEPDVD